MGDGTVAGAIRVAAGLLESSSGTARLDAELLMAHALGLTRSDMLLRAMAGEAPAGFAAMAERRAASEPVAHITGLQEFYGLTLSVTPDVLIPRADSETLIEAARACFPGNGPGRILDLGTGSGALVLAALSIWPRAEAVAIDSSPAALAVAQSNAAALGESARVVLSLKDWRMPGWNSELGRFDLILCNPPYVEDDAALDPDVRVFEPGAALFAGPDGLDAYRVLVPQLAAMLAPQGTAAVEIGHRQAAAVTALAETQGLAVALRRDLAGRPRALVMT